MRCHQWLGVLMLLFLLTALPGASVTITPTSNVGSPLITDENGSSTLVVLALDSAPSGAVQVLLSNPAPGEVVLSTTTLLFTPLDWNQLRVVTITGIDDGMVDADRLVGIAVTVNAPGTNYSGVTAPDIVVRNLNRQTPGLAITASGGGTQLSEGGSGDTVNVVLTAQPTGDVTVTLNDGGGQFSASPASLVFTNANWNTPRVVSLTAINDTVAVGTRTVILTATATGSGYDGTNDTLEVTITEDDVAGIEVTPVNGLITSEAGLQAQVRLRLTSAPTGDVTVPIASSNTLEGTVGTATLLFTPQNWSAYQTVVLSGTPDGIADGDQPWTVVTGAATSTDPTYHAVNPADAAVVNRNSDVASLLATPGAVVVNQGGSTAIIQVVLATQPANAVTVTVASSNGAQATVNPTSLVFTSGAGGTWSTPQQVVVTGLPSGSVGDQTFPITCTPSGDAVYAALPPVAVSCTNQDLSQPTVLLGPVSPLSLVEGDPTTASYTVRLSTDPGIGNTIAVTPTPSRHLTVTSAPILYFDHDSFATTQTVTVQAVDDVIADGIHTGEVAHLVTGSYAAVTLTLPITDNDQAGILATPLSGLTTTETGGSTSFTVVLSSQPIGPVTVPVTSSDSSQGTVAPSSLTFTPTGATAWNLPQTIIVTGADGNAFDDGDVPFDVLLGPATSGDAPYSNLVGSPVGLVNQRVDHPPTLTALPDLIIPEDAGAQTIPLVGISSGQAGEVQVISITATGDNPALTGALTVDYTSPAGNGTIRFTPTANASGDALITVLVSAGTTTLTRTCLVHVTAVNDLPLVVRNTPLVVGYRGTGLYQGLNADVNAAGQLAASDVETAAAALVYRLALAPIGGYLVANGVRLANGDTFTQAEVDGGLLRYTHDGANGASDGFAVQVDDGTGGLGDTVVVSITIDRASPAVDILPPGLLTWAEGSAAVAIAATGQVADLDSPHFATGFCTVDILSGGHAGDLLAINHVGNGPGQIGVSGSTVSWGGVPMGTWTGGTWPTPLTITFNATTTPAVAQALLRQIVFSNTTRDPGATTRNLSVVISDEAGHACPAQSRTLEVTVVNDVPAALTDTLYTVADVAVPGQLPSTDPDGPSALYTITAPPGRGQLADFDPATGAFLYIPDPGASGIDHITFTVDDGLAVSAPGTVTVHITGAANAQRLWFYSDPPLVAQAGEPLQWTAHLDVSELSAAPHLFFSLEDAPTGMAIVPDAVAGTVLVTWPVATGSGHVRCRLRAWDAVSDTADVQSVVIYVQPLPGGGG